MPFAFLIVGAAFLIAGVRGKDDELLSLLKGDFTGSPNFVAWLFALLVVGAIGYIETLKPISRAFLALIIVVMFLSNGGFFSKLTTQLKPTRSVAQ